MGIDLYSSLMRHVIQIFFLLSFLIVPLAALTQQDVPSCPADYKYFKDSRKEGCQKQVGEYRKIRHGLWKLSFPNEKPMGEEHWQDGQKVGTWILLHQDGTKRRVEKFVEGNPVSEVTEYFSNGTIKSKGSVAKRHAITEATSHPN